MVSGHEVGIGIYGMGHQYEMQELQINKVQDLSKDLLLVCARYNRTAIVTKDGRVYLWGENAQNLRLRKPKLFHVFSGGV